MTEKEKICEEETYRIDPDDLEIGGEPHEDPRKTIPLLPINGPIGCMVDRFHWLVGSGDGREYDIELVKGDRLNELDQLQTAFAAYQSRECFKYELEIKSLRLRAEYRLIDGIPPTNRIITAFNSDPWSAIVMLGRAFRNCLSSIACKGSARSLNEPVLKSLVASGCISVEEAEAAATAMDYSDLTTHIIRIKLPDKYTIALWLSVYRKIATAAL